MNQIEDDELLVNNKCNNIEEVNIEELQTSDLDAATDKLGVEDDNDVDYLQSPEWTNKQKHIFILSSAGKPIYSRYGNEDNLVTLFGVMQALVSVIEESDDEIESIQSNNKTITFLKKDPIILVSVSQSLSESYDQAVVQLNYVYNQVISVLTLSQLTRIFENHNNFDLRRLLSGAEKLIDNLLTFTENEPGFFLQAVECLILPSQVRETIVQSIITTCSKIKNLLFALMISDKHLITYVRMKKYKLQVEDIHLIFNLVSSSQSFRSAESWTPICLPNFDPSGFLQAHVSYLADDCQVCLLLITVDRDLFFELSEAKKKIVDKLIKGKCLDEINDALSKRKLITSELNISDIRHFLYKVNWQYICPNVEAPYIDENLRNRLFELYKQVYHQLSNKHRPLKLLYQQFETETVLAWNTKSFELYIVLEPFVTKQDAINAVNKLLKAIKKEEDKLFFINSPTF